MNFEEQFRQSLFMNEDKLECKGDAWAIISPNLRHQQILSESFLREMKDILNPFIFNELIIHQQLSINFAREIGIT